MISLKSEREIEIMRQSANILKKVFIELLGFVKEGMTTLDVDAKAEKTIRSLGGEPAFKGYRDFPGTICASVNDEVVHGIPSKRVLQEGDIFSLDMGVKYQGYYSDSARTLPIGQISAEAKKLIEVTRDSVFEGVQAIKKGNRLGDVSSRIQKHIEKHKYGVVREFVGHGIGKELHEDPQVPNYGESGTGIELKEGLVIAVEPMVNLGSAAVCILDDGWTVVTEDGRLSAHHEEMIAITTNGPEVLTSFERDI